MTEPSYKRLSDAELEIMKIIWAANSSVTSADVIDRIEPRGRWATTTVLNFLSRLMEKGFLSTRKQGKMNVYTPEVEEALYLEQEGCFMLQRLYNGSLVTMVESLYSAEAIDSDDLTDLADFIVHKTGIVASPPHDTVQSGDSRWRSWYKRYFRT